jgi:acyl-CoA reductase-like NAD-dependent aldehyde dehydrogenase
MSAPAELGVLDSGFLLDGQWVCEGRCVEVRRPAQGHVVGRVWWATAEHLQHAIEAAVRTFAQTRRMPSWERRAILERVADRVAATRDDWARLIALEAGKPLKAARIEVERAVLTWRVAAEEAPRIGGEWLSLDWMPSAAGRWGIVRRFPVGPLGAITPFNFPLNLVTHKWAPAMAAGCTVVHKPAPQTPLCALRLAAVVSEAGWPAGALNVLPLTHEDADALVRDDRLRLLTFTGSSRVGWALRERAGHKRVVLELGGNAAVIVHHDADLADAAARCVAGGFSFAGQSCISVQRIFVHRTVEERFLAELLPRVQALRIGDPLDEATDVGPMISEEAAARASAWIEEAVSGGARLLVGGRRQGAFLEPTVLTGTRPEMQVQCEEIFAPVVVVEPYDDFEQALALVNQTRYGLQAGVFTTDARLIFRAFEELEVGGVIAGDVPTWRIDHMPYGGVKDSGLGREGVRYAILEMTEPRLLVMALGQPSKP